MREKKWEIEINFLQNNNNKNKEIKDNNIHCFIQFRTNSNYPSIGKRAETNRIIFKFQK